MKRTVFLASTALALISAQSQAAEWELKWGGYMEQFVAFSTADGPDGLSNTDFDGVDSKQDAEIHFKPTITLDNGIKIGANIQLEAFQSGDQIDESYLFIKGSFGEILLGSENSAGYKMHYGAPDVTFLNVNSGSLTAYVPFSGAVSGSDPVTGVPTTVRVGDDVFRGTLGTTYLENDRNNDAQRFTYFTPRFAGFQLGVSYARDAVQDDNFQVNCSIPGQTCDYFDIGANYVNSFGGFDVAISGRWGIATNEGPGSNNPQVFGAGINLGFAGVTIGGSFAEQNNTTTSDGTAFDAGISYQTGPWGFSFTYFHGENVDNENVANPLGNDETLDQYLLGVNYKLAKGVSLGAFGAYVDFDEDRGDPGSVATNGNDVDGFVIGTGVKVRF